MATTTVDKTVDWKQTVQENDNSLAFRHAALSHMMKRECSITALMSALEAHISDVPTDTPGWKALGNYCLRLGLWKEARVCFEELALVLDTNCIYNFITLADICYTLGSYVPALKYFCIAVYYEPCSPRALWGLVTVYGAMLENRDLYEEKIEKSKSLAVQGLKKLTSLYAEELELCADSNRKIYLQSCQKLLAKFDFE